MKNYVIFAVVAIALYLPYYMSSYFVEHRYIEKVQPVNLPQFSNKKIFEESNIRVSALFREKSKVANLNKKAVIIRHKKSKRKMPVVLTMIYANDKTKVCTINGSLFREGEYKRGIRVLKIENKRVLVETKKSKRWLVLDVLANKKG